MIAGDTITSAEANKPQMAGLWRRSAAFLIDAIILWLVSLATIFLYLHFYPQALGYAAYIGFIQAVLYFGLMNSSSCHGTVGKKLLDIRVVNRSGNDIGLLRSFLRAAVLSSVILLQNFGAFSWLAFAYMFIFNGRTRQSLHDVIAGTLVVRRESRGAPTARSGKLHYLIAAIILAVTVWPVAGAISAALTTVFTPEPKRVVDPSMQDMAREIEKMKIVKDIQVDFGEMEVVGEPIAKKYMIVEVLVKQVPTAKMEVKIARIIFEKYPPAQNYDAVAIQLTPVAGLNNFVIKYNLSPRMWQREIDKLPKPPKQKSGKP